VRRRKTRGNNGHVVVRSETGGCILTTSGEAGGADEEEYMMFFGGWSEADKATFGAIGDVVLDAGLQLVSAGIADLADVGPFFKNFDIPYRPKDEILVDALANMEKTHACELAKFLVGWEGVGLPVLKAIGDLNLM
jgi:hypothetical protein